MQRIDRGATSAGSQVGANVGRQIAQHVRHYAENPRAHAQALRKLGVSPAKVREVHRTMVAQKLPPRMAAAHTPKQVSSFAHSPFSLAEKAVGDLADAAIHSPAGMYRVGKGVYHDVGDTLHGKPTVKRTAGIGKQIVKQTAADLRHPLRHPGYTLLDIAAVAGAGEGAAARGVASVKAAREGASVAQVAKAAVKRPLTGTVEHREGDLVVKTPASKRAGVAAIQKSRAKQGARAVGKALTQERQVTEAVERAPMEALHHRSRKLTTPQQTALRVVNEGKSVADRIKFHEKMQAEASRLDPGAVRHRQKALLLKAADRYLVHDKAGVPALKPVEQAASGREARALGRLHDTQASLVSVAKKREQRLSLLGDLGDGRIEARLHGPGRVIGGAEYVKTPASKGRVEQVREYPGRSKTVTRPRTEQEAKARLGELDKQYDKMVSAVAKTGERPGDFADLTRRRNMQAKKRANRGLPPLPKVSDELRKRAEDTLHTVIEKRPDSPVAQKALAMIREREELQAAVNEHALGDGSLGNVTETIPGKPRRVHLREIQQQRATSGLRGAEDFQGGKQRIPYTAESPAKSLGTHAGFRGGIPRKPGSVTHEFKGGLLRSGNFRDDTARLVAESGLEAQRFTALHRLRDRVIAAAHDTPREGDIAVRLDAMKGKPFPAAVKAAMRKREEGVKLSKEERQTLADAHDSTREELFPQIDPAQHAEHKDVVWVDPQVLDGLDKQQYRAANAFGHKPVAAVDAINNASKLAILYLKPAYAIPNIVGNAALNIAQQGPHAMTNWWESSSRKLDKHLGTEATATLDSVMGEGVAGAISSDAGAGTKLVQGAAGAWGRVVDRVFRRAAFLHEAKRLGYRSPEQLKRLLTDDAHRDQLVEAAQRAKEAIIDYDRLGQREKEVVRRLIFFYPWVKGSTRYAGHFLAEHPIQSAAVGNLGQYGKQHEGLGPTPSYLEGAFKVGHNKLVNPAAAAIFQTPAQVYQAIHALSHGNVTQAEQLGSFATPALGLAISEIARQDSFGNPISPKASGLDIAKQSLLESTPQYTLYKRLTAKDKSRRLFPLSPAESVAQFSVGGIAPRSYNPDVLHSQAKAEQRGLLSPEQRWTSDYKQLRGTLKQAFAKEGEKKIPHNVAARLSLRMERVSNRVRAAGGHQLDSRTALKADIDLIVRHKWMSPAEAKQAKHYVDTAPKAKLGSVSRFLTTHYFDSDGLLSDTFTYLRDKGHDIRYPPLP